MSVRSRPSEPLTPITPKIAQEAIAAELPSLRAESRPLEQCGGQILRQDIFAERDNPPFDRVCMDGIAISSSALAGGRRRFVIEAILAAGAPPVKLTRQDHAIEVMTGAVLPEGTDCVIPQEEYEQSHGAVCLNAHADGEPYRNVQRRGEDSQPGVAMLKAGVRLGAPEIGVAASAGLAQVQVSCQPRFMVVSTGDELVEPGKPIAAHQIRRSNAYSLVAALRSHGFEKVANDHIADDERLLRERLARHAASQDVLILSGGVSKGKYDFVPKVLQDLKVREVFYQVAQRPGMPMWFGMSAGGCAVFGLPGNPVSTLVLLVRYIIPAVSAAMGARPTTPERIALAGPVKFARALTYFLPVAVRYDELGRPSAVPRPTNGPGDFLGLTAAEGFVELPPRPDGFPEGFVANLYRW
jgi:molybdopterin molybdotransferase